MHYILIFLMGFSHMSFTAEFNDQKSCQNAIEAINQISAYSVDRRVAFCVPKGGNS